MFDDINEDSHAWNGPPVKALLKKNTNNNNTLLISKTNANTSTHNPNRDNICNATSDLITRTSFDVQTTPHPLELSRNTIYHSAYPTLKITLPSEYPGVTLNINGLGFELIIAFQRLRHSVVNRTFDHINANLRTMHRLLWQASYKLSFSSRNDY